MQGSTREALTPHSTACLQTQHLKTEDLPTGLACLKPLPQPHLPLPESRKLAQTHRDPTASRPPAQGCRPEPATAPACSEGNPSACDQPLELTYGTAPTPPPPTLIPVSGPTEGRSQAKPSRGEPGGIPCAGCLSHTYIHHARYLCQLGASHCASGRSMELSQAR